MTILLFVAGITLLVVGAESLVRGATRIAAAAGISHLVIGLTIVAFGTSAPEMAVGVAASLEGEPDLALGNVLGSNIFNVLAILGLSAALAPLVVSRRLVRLEVPLMVLSSLLLLAVALDGTISRGEGLLLVAGGVAYLLFLFYEGRETEAEEPDEPVDQRARGEHGDDAVAPSSGPEDDAPGNDPAPAADPAAPTAPAARLLVSILLIGVGLAGLVLGSRWLVEGARAFALALGVSELIIGLTIVAIGTSLPELATSIVATVRGERDIAVGNVVGSNLFNILFILGVAAAVAPEGVPAAPAALRFDIPVVIGVSLACIPVFFTGLRIERWEGILFMAYYAAYTLYIILATTHHDALQTFRLAMGTFVLPLTVITFAVVMLRRRR